MTRLRYLARGPNSVAKGAKAKKLLLDALAKECPKFWEAHKNDKRNLEFFRAALNALADHMVSRFSMHFWVFKETRSVAHSRSLYHAHLNQYMRRPSFARQVIPREGAPVRRREAPSPWAALQALEPNAGVPLPPAIYTFPDGTHAAYNQNWVFRGYINGDAFQVVFQDQEGVNHVLDGHNGEVPGLQPGAFR
jgi:hypothetical protein